jgi:predicted ArsR family transcriptional regulator
MNQRLITEIGKSQRLALVNTLKRTQGLSVRELSAALKMSYMGVKQICLELARLGYLDTWRRPRPPGQVGRPELAYRLTRKAHELFPETSNETTLRLLEAAQILFGPKAAEKLLFTLFQKKTEACLAKIKGETVAERARQLAALRDAEGCMASVETGGEGEASPAAASRPKLRIVERHSPIADLQAAYPALLPRLEQDLYTRVLRTPVKREQTLASGLYEAVFRVA